MKIADVLSSKGSEVFTIPATATVADLVAELAKRGIGAAIVTGPDGQLAGIASERDVVRHLGPDSHLAVEPVSSIMTSEVITCTPDHQLEELASLMTDNRVRHIPVVGPDGSLVGVVSIGDVVKQRIAQLQAERDHLERYIAQ